MKKHLQRLLAAGAAFSVLVQSSALTAFAGEQLGQSDFSEGVGLPWHICESATGKMDFSIDGGTYNITVVNPGAARTAARIAGTASSGIAI